MSFKERLDLIEQIKTKRVFTNTMPQDSLLREIYLKRLIGSLVDLDCYVSSLKHSLEDSFDDLNPMNTPKEACSLNKATLNKYNNLRDGLMTLFDSLDSFDINFLLKIINDYILLSNTKNIQFIIFELLKKYPKKVLNFFFKKLKEKKYFSYFLSFYVGIIVRFNLQENLENKSIDLFMQYFNSYLVTVKNNLQLNDKLIEINEIKFIHLCQSLIYITCFKKNVFNKYKDIIYLLINEGILRRINKNIAEAFISKHGLDIKLNSNYEYKEILEFFPFDSPCIYEVKQRIEECYVVFIQ